MSYIDIGFENFEEDFRANINTMLVRPSEVNGEWIIVRPVDYFTMLPLYECSTCGLMSSGYDPVCQHCGSNNKVNNKKCITKHIVTERVSE